jgi:hypothetical protein|tara:strand:+ start:762 stop:995 length:234 start_codon:yes stop_codon:yes gene_type:complete
MSEAGADVKLISLSARKLMPYDIETKNREEYKTLYRHYRHASGHGNMEPLLVVKMNRQYPLAVIDLDHFFELLSRAN